MIDRGFGRLSRPLEWVAVFALAACGGPAQAPAEAFDVYRVGVPVAPLVSDGSADNVTRFV